MYATLVNVDQNSRASGMRSISAVLRGAGRGATKVLAGAKSAAWTDAEAAALATLTNSSRIVGVSSIT